MNLLKLSIAIIWLLSAAIINSAKADAEVSENIRYVPAKRTYTKDAVYPKSQYQKSNAGMVEVGFMVEKNGRTSELIILESTHVDFEKPALKAVRNYVYDPALYYGEPRPSFHTIRLLFQGKQNAAVLPEFASAFREIQAMLESKDAESEIILERIQDLKDQGMLNPYATTQVNKLSYFHAKRFGTSEEQIRVLKALLLYQRNSGENGRFLDDKTAIVAYGDLFNLYLKNANYHGAQRAYGMLASLDPKFKKVYKDAVDQLSAIAEDDRAFEMAITLSERGFIAVNLWKRKFSFFDVQGNITKLKLRCDLNYQELQFQAEFLYQVPLEWGDCNMQVIGDAGAKVALVQQ
jgi:TonB family protein